MVKILLLSFLLFSFSAKASVVQNEWCARVAEAANISFQYRDETKTLLNIVEADTSITPLQKKQLTTAIRYGAALRKQLKADPEENAKIIAYAFILVYDKCVKYQQKQLST